MSPSGLISAVAKLTYDHPLSEMSKKLHTVEFSHTLKMRRKDWNGFKHETVHGLKMVMEDDMNLDWNCLSTQQRRALTVLSVNGPADLPRELGEQLRNLGLVEPLQVGGYCISALGSTLPPARLS